MCICIYFILYLCCPHNVYVFSSYCICVPLMLYLCPRCTEGEPHDGIPLSVYGGTTSGANSHHMSSFNHHSLFSPLLKNPPLSSTLSKSPVNLTTTKTHCLFKILLNPNVKICVYLGFIYSTVLDQMLNAIHCIDTRCVMPSLDS